MGGWDNIKYKLPFGWKIKKILLILFPKKPENVLFGCIMHKKMIDG